MKGNVNEQDVPEDMEMDTINLSCPTCCSNCQPSHNNLLNACYVPGTILSAQHKFHLIIQQSYYFYSQFIDEEMETRRVQTTCSMSLY